MKTAGKIKFNLKSLLFISSLFISFSLMSQWGVAYSSGWGNSGLESYPNFFKSIDYVGDGINGHRLDIYYPTELKINLNNLGVLALNQQYDKIEKVVSNFKTIKIT